MTGVAGDREAGGVEHILEERARHLAAVPDDGRSATEEVLVLRVGDHRFSLPATRARSVSSEPAINAIGRHGPVVGIACVRGQVVAVVDLALMLALDHDTGDTRQLVVVDEGGSALGVLVDEVVDLIRVAAPAPEPEVADMLPLDDLLATRLASPGPG